MKKFEVGKTYKTTSVLNHQSVYSCKVVKRTAKTVTIDNGEEVKTCRINQKDSEHFGKEIIYPEGKYSMCIVISAE